MRSNPRPASRAATLADRGELERLLRLASSLREQVPRPRVAEPKRAISKKPSRASNRAKPGRG